MDAVRPTDTASLDRQIFGLAVPALAALATTPLYVLVDTAIVGHLGSVPLGGLALAMSLLNLLFFCATFLEYGITARVAQHVGAERQRDATGTAVQGGWLALAMGVTFALLIVLGARPMAHALGGEGDVLDAATTYVRISVAWAPAELACLVVIGYLRGVRDTRTPVLVGVVGNLANLVIELVLVYGAHLGVAGSAWGTVIATWIAAAWFVAVVVRHVRSDAPSLRPARAELRRMLKTGGHLSIRTGALLGTLALSTAVAARVSTATLGGHQIALQIETFLALLVDGLAIAGQALIGTSLGAGRIDEARVVGRRLVRWGVIAGAALLLAVLALSVPLPHLFSDSSAVRDRVTVALVIVAAMQLPAAIVFVLDGVLLGASDDAFQGWSNLVALGVYAPFALAVLHWHRLGIAGVWCGLGAWMLARLAANGARFLGGRWTRIAA